MDEESQPEDFVTKVSGRSVAETVERFRQILDDRGVRIFAVIDQREAARQAGLDLRETVLVVFGDPRAGTPVMAASPLAALDLPLKVLCWAGDGATNVSYEAPQSLAARHRLSLELASRLGAIEALTDTLVG